MLLEVSIIARSVQRPNVVDAAECNVIEGGTLARAGQ